MAFLLDTITVVRRQSFEIKTNDRQTVEFEPN